MAKEDFCFTYYDGDAARDKAHMTRLERGAYDDIISAQRKFGHLGLPVIKKILGKDFDECWLSIELILKQDEEKKYFIEWLDNSISRAQKFSTKQTENGKKGGRPKTQNEPKLNPKETQNISQKKPLEDEDGYGDEYESKNEEGGVGETKFLIPKMMEVWKKEKPKYPLDKQKDFTALNEIAEFISEQERLPYNPRDGSKSDQILASWKPISNHVATHKFFNSYSLFQVSKHIQSIVQDYQNGSSKNGKQQHSDVSTASAFNKIDKLFAENGSR